MQQAIQTTMHGVVLTGFGAMICQCQCRVRAKCWYASVRQA